MEARYEKKNIEQQQSEEITVKFSDFILKWARMGIDINAYYN